MSISEELGPSSRLELNDGPIHYRDIGDGPPIVFVHGVFVNGDLWRKVVPRLASRYRCITPDWPLGSHAVPMRPGADLSTPGLAKLVAGFIEELGLDDVTLVGNDTGGAVCQLVVADHRERIGRLVLTSCDAFEVYPPPPFGFLRLVPSLPGAAFLLGQGMRFGIVRRLPLAYGWVMSGMAPRPVMDSYTRPLLDPKIRRDARKLLRGISNEHTLQAPERFADFPGPVLLAWAGKDKLFPATLADRLSNVFRHARQETVKDSRTFIAEDQPEALADLIDDFISSARRH